MKNSIRFPQIFNAKILRDISREATIQFLDRCNTVSFHPGEVVLRQGEPTDRMVMMAEGRVEVSYLSESGHQTIIYHAFSGNVLGTVETLSGRPCAGTCTALTDVTVLMCKRSVVYELMQNPVFVRNFAADLHDVLVHDNQYKSIDQFHSAEQKICVYLRKLSATDGSVHIKNQSYLAEVVGCSRQTVNKELGRLRDQEVIEKTKGGVRILDYRALSLRLAELSDPMEALSN